jgi:hypothetical protein
MKRPIVAFVLALALLALAGQSAAQSDNLLQNPGFESPNYTQVTHDPTSTSIIFNAPYWWWGGVVTGGSQPWINAYPSGYPHSIYKHSGNLSFEMGRGGATYTAFLYQQVKNIPAGTQLHGSVWYYQNSGQGFVRVGIATDGNTFVDAPTIVWSNWQTTLHQWKELTVDATASAEGVSLFFMATQPQPSDPNFTYWDDASLVITGNGPIPPGAPTAAPAENPQSDQPSPVAGQPAAPVASGDCAGLTGAAPLDGLAHAANIFYWNGIASATSYRVNVLGGDVNAGARFASFDTGGAETHVSGDLNGYPGYRMAWNVDALVNGNVVCTSPTYSMGHAAS